MGCPAPARGSGVGVGAGGDRRDDDEQQQQERERRVTPAEEHGAGNRGSAARRVTPETRVGCDSPALAAAGPAGAAGGSAASPPSWPGTARPRWRSGWPPPGGAALPAEERDVDLVVFCAMKMISRMSTMPRATTPAQMPLVREPRSGSSALVRRPGPPARAAPRGGCRSDVVGSDAGARGPRRGRSESWGSGHSCPIRARPGCLPTVRGRSAGGHQRDRYRAEPAGPAPWARCTCSRSTRRPAAP